MAKNREQKPENPGTPNVPDIPSGPQDIEPEVFRAALVKDNLVINVIELSSRSDYTPEEGVRLIRLKSDDRVGPGWTWERGTFVEPVITSDNTEPAVDIDRLKRDVRNARNLSELKEAVLDLIDSL